MQSKAASWAGSALLALGACWLAWVSVSVNREYGCRVVEDIAMPRCGAASADPEADLRSTLLRGPADSDAWARLALLQRGTDAYALKAAGELAPNDPRILQLQADLALRAGRLDQAIDPLFRLVEMYHHLAPEAATILARVLATHQHDREFEARLRPKAKWLNPVLTGLGVAKLPRAHAFSLMSKGWKRGAVSDAEIHAYIQALKADGNWSDAYALWIFVQPPPVPILFNGGFELPLSQGAFNWDTPAGSPGKLGGQVRRRGDPARGMVLEIQFNGRPIPQPLLQQALSLVPGDYLLRGRYNISRLQSEQGLALLARCLQAPAEIAGKSSPLTDTQGDWKVFEARLQVTPACGTGVVVQLEPHAAYESRVGVRGLVLLDDLEIRRAAP